MIKTSTKQVLRLINDRLRYMDGELFWKVSIGNKKAGQRAGCLNPSRYRQVRLGGKVYLEHRLIFLLHNGTLPRVIDHVDGNPQNNCISNLRECTRAENAYNSGMYSNNTSGIKGISWCKRTGKWQAQVSVNGTNKHLGRFSTIEAAEHAVRALRQLVHGAFARHR